MAPTSDEDLQKLQNDVDTLRERVAAEEAKRVERERLAANDVTAAHLNAEKARLEAQLASAKEAGKAAAVKEGLSGPLEAAKEDQKRAESQRDAIAKASSSNTDDK